MNLREEILREYSKAQVAYIVAYIDNDKKKFKELMDLFFNDEYRVTQRASWVVSHSIEANPQLVAPYLPQMVKHLHKEGLHDAVVRNIVRIMQFVEIPEELMGEVAEICFSFLQSPKVAVAIRVFSMTVLYNITKQFPELGHELRMVIEAHLPNGSAGFKSRGKRILRGLEKMGV